MIDAIMTLIEETAAAALLPRFRTLTADQIEEKGPGDLVTIADREGEALITAGLKALVPGALVIGEEACHTNPALLDRLGEDGPVFVVDPVDGTANFAAGRPEFAVMVARLDRGYPTAAWIYSPIDQRRLVAEVGSGTWLDGARITLAAPPRLADAKGGVMVRFLDEPRRSRAEAARQHFIDVGTTQCAGHDYLRLIVGRSHFLLYWRTMAWDHAPGALLVAEAGGRVARPDGRPFACDRDSRGILSAADADLWQAVRAAALPDLVP